VWPASDHLTKQAAQVELEHFECSLPSVNIVAHTGKEEGVAQAIVEEPAATLKWSWMF